MSETSHASPPDSGSKHVLTHVTRDPNLEDPSYHSLAHIILSLE